MPWTLLLLLLTTVSSEVVDVVVVGGGLSGVAAAKEYSSLRPDHTVVLLEAKGSLGGRVHSVDMFTVNGTENIDLGAQWISSSHSDLIQLVRSLGLTLETQTSCGERKIFVEEKENQRRFTRSALGSSIPFDQVIRAAELQKFSGQSMREWIQTSNLTGNEMHIVHRILQTVLDAPENSVSALQLLLLASSESRPLGEILAGNGHGEGMRVKEGLRELVTKFSSGVDTRLDEAVLSVVKEDNGTVTVRTVKKEYSAKQVIVAVPPSIAASIHFVPPLAHDVARFLQSYAPVGHAFYFAVTYNHPWWRANNISGETVYGSREGPLTWMTTFDTGKASDCGTCGSSSGVLWGIAHFSSPLPSIKRKDLITKALLRTMVYADAEEDIIDFKDYQFSHDEYLGGTIGVLPPSTDLAFLLLINNTISHGPIYFASAELSRTSMGLMNGAILSGKQAAHIVDESIDAPKEINEPSSSPSRDGLYDSVQTPSLSDLILPSSPSPSIGITSFSQESPVFHVATEPSELPEEVVEESIDAPVVETPLRDSPVKSTTPFIYTTSTFYPSSTSPPLMDSTETFAWGPNDFDYKTSTQYPPSAAAIDFHHDSPSLAVEKEEPMSEVAESTDSIPSLLKSSETSETDAPLEPFIEPGFEFRKNRSEFDYQTSTQYPPSSTLPSGTVSSSPTATGGFNYHTSTHYPSKGTLASQVDQEEEEDVEGPAKMTVLKNEQMVPTIPQDHSAEIRTTSGAAFNYSTSTQYPPTSSSTSPPPLVHFSAGNVAVEEKKGDYQGSEFSMDEPIEKAAAKGEVTLRDHVVSEGSGETEDAVVSHGTADHVAKAKSAMQTLEEEVPLLPKEEASGIGDRLLELLHKILKLLKGE
ncbi:hypothetical protein PENTCL1PPCAC_23025 [Pristionchus entomophagus]|uniref:Amine oxidase n=1 Tax=Pristionchus entomophagus TaxID=358040 RepID=A0AAV5U1W0_9BILA|nr:hypothetical protein PENTCL1PPCAC_23025 [Pristionchus entomophagus]